MLTYAEAAGESARTALEVFQRLAAAAAAAHPADGMPSLTYADVCVRVCWRMLTYAYAATVHAPEGGVSGAN
jgi:hypothetical protein